MAKDNQEIESKFYVLHLGEIQSRLEMLGAVCLVPRGFEYNLRFDNRQNSLTRQHKVLRLRKSDDIRLTYKGPGERLGNVLSRTEVELVVTDFNQAQTFLESLGYHVVAVYEKYRAMYQLGHALITLDELPYGNFVEIEGETPDEINQLAGLVGLKPETAIPMSYQGLFEQVKMKNNLPVKNLSFWEFEKISLSASDLGVEIADQNE